MSVDLRRAEPSRPEVLRWVVAVPAALFVVLAFSVAVDLRPVVALDDHVADWAYDVSASRDGLVSFLDAVAVVFSNLVCGIALAVLAGLAVWRHERRIAIWIVASGVVAIAGNALLKLVFRRDRPSFLEPLHEIGGFSFPSGHSSGSGMFFTVAILLTIVLTGRGLRRRVIVTVLGAIALGVGASRIFLGVHYLSDVVAGLSFGTAVTVGLWLLIATDATRIPAELAALTGTGRRLAAVVLNPVKVGDVEEFKDRVRVVAAREGWQEPLFYETTIEDPGHGQALQALEAEADLIIAAGGDGTVRAVCEEAARTGVAVGILPHGTGNLLARNLGIPLNARDALDVAFGGQDKAIDLATYTTDSGVDTVFLVMAGLGMDAMIMTGVDDVLKEKVGWFAYVVSGAKALRYPGMKVEITVDDQEPRKFRARTVVIGNVGFLQAGFPLLPAAEIDDGLLDVVVLAPRRFFGWISIAWRVLTRRKKTNEKLDRFTGSKVHVKASSLTPMQLDGDPVGEGLEITAEVQHGVLLVRVPLTPAPVAPLRLPV